MINLKAEVSVSALVFVIDAVWIADDSDSYHGPLITKILLLVGEMTFNSMSFADFLGEKNNSRFAGKMHRVNCIEEYCYTIQYYIKHTCQCIWCNGTNSCMHWKRKRFLGVIAFLSVEIQFAWMKVEEDVMPLNYNEWSPRIHIYSFHKRCCKSTWCRPVGLMFVILGSWNQWSCYQYHNWWCLHNGIYNICSWNVGEPTLVSLLKTVLQPFKIPRKIRGLTEFYFKLFCRGSHPKELLIYTCKISPNPHQNKLSTVRKYCQH